MRSVMVATDEYDLARFVNAQASVYPQALAELRRGAKRSHWMWFIFPQLVGLGRSEMAQRYAITGLMKRGRIWRIRCWARATARSWRLCRI
jgi:uncharacterized protein (DUF1810 family)